MSERVWRVGVWCAVSSKPQADPEKESLPAQETAGREFARVIGGEVARVYHVPGHSRNYWNWYEAEREMPAYEQVRADLEAGRLDVVHCLDADRLGRDPALIQQFYSLAEKCGAEVYDASMPHQLGQQSIGHRYGTAVKSVAAGEDQRRRVYRHRSGMRGRVKRGLHPSNWPFGLAALRDEHGTVTGAEFSPDIAAVQLASERFLDGHSYAAIAEELNRSPWRPPGSDQWRATTVWRLLMCDTYAGIVSWGDVQQASDRFPALWDGETYAAIVRERRRRSEALPADPRSGPLRSVARCKRCGGPMGQTSGWKGTRYLRCGRHARLRSCHPNCIKERPVLDELGAWLAQWLDVDTLAAAFAEDDQIERLEAELAGLEHLAAEMGTQRKRLALAFASGSMGLDIYRDADAELLSRSDRATSRAREVRALLESQPDLDQRLAAVQAAAESFTVDLHQADPVLLSTELQRAGVVVWIEQGQIRHILFM